MASRRAALIFGSNGALGRDVVKAFAGKGWSTFTVDLNNAEHLIKPGESIAAQQQSVLGATACMKFDAIINVAGGWAGGNVADVATAANTDLMISQSINSSIVCGHIGAVRGNKNLLMVFTGSAAALNPTSFMLGYGLAKAGVHHLVRSIASDPALLPEGSTVLGILPHTLDTPGNRAGMPTADFSKWTPTPVVAEELLRWAEAAPTQRPKSGSLVVLETAAGKTQFVPKL
jgi:dihydropteridine reductase